jgi:hypothetical protein
MDYWSWRSGRPVGYDEDGYLYTWDGQCVGQFVRHEVYAPDGWYLGEADGEWLMRDRRKATSRSSPFTTPGRNSSQDAPGAVGGNTLWGGFEDFPEV